MANWRSWPMVARGGGWLLATICAIAATLCYAGYMAQGMVVGDLIGLPGREPDIAAAQVLAHKWLVYSALWQCGVALNIFAAFRIGTDLSPFPRYALRASAAGALSLLFTVAIGIVLMGALRLVYPRHF
jgi:hypothetical protein